MPDRQRWAGLVVIGLAVSLVVVDITILNVTIPAIVADLGISAGEVQWVHEAYTLLFAALLLVFGRLDDGGARALRPRRARPPDPRAW